MVPYIQPICKGREACILLLLDESCSMEEPLGHGSQRKCDVLARAVNTWLQYMAIRSSGDNGINGVADIGIYGYRTDSNANTIVESLFQGPLAGETLPSIVEIGNNPLGIETVTKLLVDEDTGEIIETPSQMPVWVDLKSEGGSPLCGMLYHAYDIIEQWIAAHLRSFPPIVINVTDGESQDGDPFPYAEALTNLNTEDGNVLLFNCHLSMTSDDPCLFPSTDEVLPDKLARDLFRMSSVLPESFICHANADGFDLQPNARGMAFNADKSTLIRFLEYVTEIRLHV